MEAVQAAEAASKEATMPDFGNSRFRSPLNEGPGFNTSQGGRNFRSPPQQQRPFMPPNRLPSGPMPPVRQPDFGRAEAGLGPLQIQRFRSPGVRLGPALTPEQKMAMLLRLIGRRGLF